MLDLSKICIHFSAATDPLTTPWHTKQIIESMLYEGGGNTEVTVLMPDGYTYRFTVWGKATVGDLWEMMSGKIGRGVYRIEMWHTEFDRENRVEKQVLLPVIPENYNIKVKDMAECKVALKVTNYMYEEFHYKEYEPTPWYDEVSEEEELDWEERRRRRREEQEEYDEADSGDEWPEIEVR